MNVVVVSNRVARAKPDEPLAGGLAAALLPMVRDSGAIWVGSNGPSSDTAPSHDSFAKVEALGTGALATVDMPAEHYRGFYEGFANSALWPALHSRPDLIHVTAEDYDVLPRDQRLHGARFGALQFAASGVLDSGLSLPVARRGIAPARYRAAARLLPAHAVGRTPHHVGRAALHRTRRSDAGLRSDRLSDRRGPPEFRGLSAHRARPQCRRRHGRLALGADPARNLPDRHRRRGIRHARDQGDQSPRSGAAARQHAWRQTRPGRRSPRLFEGTRQSHARHRPHARNRALGSNAICRSCRSPCRRAAISKPIAS